MKRRDFLSGLTLVAGTAPFPLFASPASKSLKVGIVYQSSIGDAGWNYQHNLSIRALEKQFGADVVVTRVENVPDTADSERVFRQLAMQGNQLIIGTTFGYMNSMLKVAKEFPKATFLNASGYKTAANMACYSASMYDGTYLAGGIAASVTKSKVLGFIGAVPIPEVFRNLNAFTLGARKVDPSIQVKVVWINAWHDPGKERLATLTLINGGADVVLQDTNSTAPVAVAQERGVFSFGWTSDMSAFGPKTCLGSVVADWSDYYLRQASQVIAGTWKSSSESGSLRDKFVDIRGLNEKLIPSAALVRFKSDRELALQGKLDSFAGPFKDSKGVLRVPAGGSLSVADRDRMDWTVEGVVGTPGG
ncbi:BMP family ABC transporter substrate-binding protein [Cupriavidus necator]